jgi:hypothetical protein
MNITEQITRAILRGEKTFKSTSGMYEVKLPSPQTAGTGMQRETYARLEAQKIVDLKVHDLWPRVCDYSNRGMCAGYTDMDVYADKDQTEALLKDLGYDKMYYLLNELGFYYTEWEDLDEDENFTSSGALIEMTNEMKSYLK